MIDPQHRCGWTPRRLTDLGLHDGWFSSTGVSLRVLLLALHEPSLAWFSRVYGEYDDNTVAVAVDKSEPGTLPSSAGGLTAGPVTHRISDLCDVTEYPLTDDVCDRLGIRANEDGFLVPSASAGLHCFIHVHDDCFAGVRLPDERTLNRLMLAVMDLHSFCLGRDVEWGSITEALVALLDQHRSLSIRQKRTWSGQTIVALSTAGRWRPKSIGRIVFAGDRPQLLLSTAAGR